MQKRKKRHICYEQIHIFSTEKRLPRVHLKAGVFSIHFTSFSLKFENLESHYKTCRDFFFACQDDLSIAINVHRDTKLWILNCQKYTV